MYMLNYQYPYWVTLRLSTVPISSYISSLWTCSNIVTLRQLHTHSISARLYLYNYVSIITSAVYYKNAHWILHVKKIFHELLSGTHIGCKPVLFAKWYLVPTTLSEYIMMTIVITSLLLPKQHRKLPFSKE